MMAEDPRARAAARRWGFLDAWLKNLQQHLSYEENEEVDERSMHSKLKNLCVYIPWPPEDTRAYHQKLLRLREAAELVGLMLEMDKYAWLLIRDPGREALEPFDPDDYNDDDLRPRYLFKAQNILKGAGDSVKSIKACAQLLSVMDLVDYSAAYRQARQRILRMDDRGRLRGFQVPISLLFDPMTVSDTRRIPRYLQQASEIVRRIGAQGTSTLEAQHLYPFKLQNVIVRPSTFAITRVPDGNSIQEFVDRVLDQGIHIPELAINLQSPEVRTLGRLLLTATQASGHSQHRPHRAKIDSLKIEANRLTAFICVCSAVVSSRTLTRLHVSSGFDDEVEGNRAEKWKWLGFALLSRASISSVQELYIDEGCLSLSDIDALKSTALSPHPIQEFAFFEPDTDDEDVDGLNGSRRRKYSRVDRKVRLTPTAMVRLFSVNGKDRKLSRLSVSTSEYFPVVTEESESEWMEIVIPGYGCAWVSCDSIVDVAVAALDRQLAPHRLKTLHLAFDDCEAGAIAAMITAVGRSLVVLNISSKMMKDVLSADVLAILDSCPNLTMLRIKCAKIGTLQHFIRAYEDNRCRISALSLYNVEVSNSSLCTFAQVLTDPTHAMTKTLVEFRYINDVLGCPGDIHRPDKKGLQLFLDMLHSNRTLSFFEIGLGYEFFSRFARRFEQLDGRRLASHARDVPLENKLAFLSCVTISTDKGIKRLRPSAARGLAPVLSQRLIANVFGFARRRVTQNVSVAKILA